MVGMPKTRVSFFVDHLPKLALDVQPDWYHTVSASGLTRTVIDDLHMLRVDPGNCLHQNHRHFRSSCCG